MSTPVTNLGASASAQIGLLAVAASAGSVNGPSIDTRPPGSPQYYSAKIIAQAGAATGSPTAQSLDVHVEDSPDGSTWTDVPNAVVPQIDADGEVQSYDLNLKGTARYIRCVGVTAFTGGTSPTLPSSATVVLMGPSKV